MTYIAVPDTAYTTPASGLWAAFTPRGQVVLWLASGLVLNGAQLWLFQTIWLAALLVLGVHGLWVLVLLVWLWRGARRQSHWSAAAMVILFPAMGILSDRIAFTGARFAFDAVIADIEAGRITQPTGYYGEAHGVEFRFFQSKEPLVVFNWIKGFPDGGAAFVYDARENINDRISAGGMYASRISNLLMGQATSCERIADPHYYVCDFG